MFHSCLCVLDICDAFVFTFVRITDGTTLPSAPPSTAVHVANIVAKLSPTSNSTSSTNNPHILPALLRSFPLQLLLKDDTTRAAASIALKQFLPDAVSTGSLDAAAAGGGAVGVLDRRTVTADLSVRLSSHPMRRLTHLSNHGVIRLNNTTSTNSGTHTELELTVLCGDRDDVGQSDSHYVRTPFLDSMLASMLVDHAVGRDLCVVRPSPLLRCV